MRPAVSALLLLAVLSWGGCGGGAATTSGCAATTPHGATVGYDACLGLPCGTPCDPCAGSGCPPTPAATACNGNQDCTVPVTWDACYVPCAGLACGAACRQCPPGAADCLEPTVVLACDRNGRCEPGIVGTCP